MISWNLEQSSYKFLQVLLNLANFSKLDQIQEDNFSIIIIRNNRR
jgi:hypothetical protein